LLWGLTVFEGAKAQAILEVIQEATGKETKPFFRRTVI